MNLLLGFYGGGDVDFSEQNSVICGIASFLPPLFSLLVTPQELLKRASHDINSRAFLGKPLSGKL